VERARVVAGSDSRGKETKVELKVGGRTRWGDERDHGGGSGSHGGGGGPLTGGAAGEDGLE
jgi:hypothetical protein